MSSSPQSLTSHRSPSPVPLAPSTETVPPPAMEHGLAKVLGCGVMRGEVRIGQASSPPGFDEAGRPTVQNLKRWIGPVHRDRRGSRPVHAFLLTEPRQREGRHYRLPKGPGFWATVWHG